MSEDILKSKGFTLKIKIIFFVVLLLLNGLCSLFIEPIIMLTENQILYLMSTMAQVIAGLFGLVLAAYAIIDPKLKAEAESDDIVKESLDILRKRYFDNIILLSIFCASTIFSCLLALGCFETIPNDYIPTLLNQSVLLCVISVIFFLVFGCSLLNPNTLSDMNSKALKEVNNEYDDADLQLRPFIEFYNRLESLIFSFALELENRDLNYPKYDNKGRPMRMQIFQALSILKMHEIINNDAFTKLNELRRYRNALVHSTDEVKVNSAVFGELQEMYNKLYAVYENRNDKQCKDEKVRELYEFSKKISLSVKDKKILEIMYNHPNATLKEISSKLQYSRASVSRSINELIEKEKINCIDGEYKVLVDESEFLS